jgi:lysophosphatidic acid phosphatase type 6
MEDAAAGKAGSKMHLYSGHDSSVLPLLVALGKEVAHWPPYLSHLVFELWQRPGSGEHYVKVCDGFGII